MSIRGSKIRWLLDAYHRLLKGLLAALMGLIVVPVVLQVLSRYTGVIPRYIWTEEVARFCFVWIVMIGSMVAVRDGTHFQVDVLPAPKTSRGRGIGDAIVHVAMLILALTFAWYGVGFAQFGGMQTSEMSGINMATIYVAFPLAGVTWTLFLVEKLVADVYRTRHDAEPPAAARAAEGEA